MCAIQFNCATDTYKLKTLVSLLTSLSFHVPDTHDHSIITDKVIFPYASHPVS